MQQKVPFTNTKDHSVYSSDGQLVPAGETRMVLAPLELAAAPEAAPDHVLEMLDNSIADVVPHLANLGIPELKRMLAAEQAGKTRKGMIEAIELRIMEAEDAAKLAGIATAERGAIEALVAGDIAAAIACVPGLNPDGLKLMLEIEEAKGDAARTELVDAIEARLTELEGAGSGA